MIFHRSQFLSFRLFFLISLFLSIQSLEIIAQSATETEINNAYEAISELYGQDMALTNGIVFGKRVVDDISHPYFNTDEFVPGSIVLRGKKYDNILLKYDLFEQEIIVYIKDQEPPFAFLPPNLYISEFSLLNKRFKSLSFNQEPSKFYQLVYEGEINCLYLWTKNRQINNRERYSAFEYLKQTKKSYLLINNELKQYRNNSSFVKLLPDIYSREIKAYLKNNRIKLNKASDGDVAGLISYCEVLMQNNKGVHE